MKTKETTTKSAKASMFIFMLHFAKINFINTVKTAFIPMFKGFSLIGLWTLPLIINCNTICNTRFNMYYIIISVITFLLAIVINGVYGDMHHAVYLNSKEYKLSFYYKMLIKLYSIL